MFSKKLVVATSLAFAISMLGGCASYKDPNGLPKRYNKMSEANRIGYFMGLSLKDRPAPEGYDTSKNTLINDVAFSGAYHGLNHMTGAMDIGSFGFELGLSLATNILKHEDEEYNQAMMYLPAQDYDSKQSAYVAAMIKMSDHLKAAATKLGYKTYKTTSYRVFGRDYIVLWVENKRVGCQQSKKDSERCFLNVSFDDDDMRDEPFVEASYLGLDFAPSWKIPCLRISQNSPKTSKLEQDMPNILNTLAKQLPANTWLYIAPFKLEKNWTAPYISDGTNAYFFVKPQEK